MAVSSVTLSPAFVNLDFTGFSADVRASVPSDTAHKIIQFVSKAFPTFSALSVNGSYGGSWEEGDEDGLYLFKCKTVQGTQIAYVRLFIQASSYKDIFQYIYLTPRDNPVVCKKKKPYQLSIKHWDSEIQNEMKAFSRLKTSSYFLPTELEFHLKAATIPKALVSPWCFEGDLSAFLIQRPTITFDVKKDLAFQICTAVRQIHAEKLVHGDLKPSNILVLKKTVGYAIKIIDFGNCSEENQVIPLPKTTRAYAAPETWERDLPSAFHHDIWSLGITLIELFLGSSTNFFRSSYERTQYNEHLMQNFLMFPHIQKSYIVLQKKLEQTVKTSSCPYATLLAQLIRLSPSERISAQEAAAILSQ